MLLCRIRVLPDVVGKVVAMLDVMPMVSQLPTMLGLCGFVVDAPLAIHL